MNYAVKIEYATEERHLSAACEHSLEGMENHFRILS